MHTTRASACTSSWRHRVRFTTAPLVTVICPTCSARHATHALVFKWFAAQAYPNTELIVVDDAPKASSFFADCHDKRVKYERVREGTTIGTKRNRAIELSRGNIIAHFDDDDAYGPDYLSRMVAVLLKEGHDLVKLIAWYNYDVVTDVVGRVDHDARLPYPVCTERERMRLSYGWSYVYRRALSACIPFPPTCWGEDACLVRTAVMFGLSVGFVSDVDGFALHTLHSGSTSRLLCQEHVPRHAAQRAPGSFLHDALATHRETAVLGRPRPTASTEPDGLFVWDLHAKRKMWARPPHAPEVVPDDGEGEMCEEFGLWMEAQVEVQEGGFVGRPEGFRREMAARREGHPPPPLELPAAAHEALIELGVRGPKHASGRKPGPLPLAWPPERLKD